MERTRPKLRKAKAIRAHGVTTCQRDAHAPGGYAPRTMNQVVLMLQRSLGNRAVQTILADASKGSYKNAGPAVGRLISSSPVSQLQAKSAVPPSRPGPGSRQRTDTIQRLQRQRKFGTKSRQLLRLPANTIQCVLDNQTEVRAEIARLTRTRDIPAAVANTLFRRVRLRRQILRLESRRDALRRRYIRVFPNGDWGFVGITQSGFTARDSALIDRILRLQRIVSSRHRDPVPFRNVRLVIVDPLGAQPRLDDAIRIAETSYSFEQGSEFGVRTRWRRTRGFPRLPQRRPTERLAYEFVAVMVPTDIASNNVAAAQTARNAVRSNARIFDARQDRARVTRVHTIDAFISWFQGLNSSVRRENRRVRQLEVFSHGGLDGPMFGRRRLQFNFSGATSRGARPLSRLPTLPYTGDAVSFFRGCRIGSGNFLRAFAQQQGVAAYGFAGTTSFSTRPRAFYAWERGTPAYQLDFPGSETWSQISGRHPRATPPVGHVPEREVVQRKGYGERVQTRVSSTVVGRIARYDEIIDRVAMEEGIHPNLVRGIIAAESGGRASLRAPSGYTGLMQAGRSTAHRDPETSIRAGVRKFLQFRTSLSRFLQRNGVDPRTLNSETMIGLVMVAYNAGPGTVQRAMRYAIAAGNIENWLEPEHFQRALIYYGAYSVTTALHRALQRLTGSELARELSQITGEDMETIEGRFFRSGRWNARGLRAAIIAHVNQERRNLRRQNLTLSQVRARASRWVLYATEFKHRNLRSWYVDRVLEYMRHFNRVRPVEYVSFETPEVVTLQRNARS